MFGKLLKYEFKTTSKWYLLITLIALGLSVLTGIISGSSVPSFVNMEVDTMQMVTGTLGILIFGGIIGLYLSNYYIIIRRFYSNLYGREGYLTWTLPASPHAIILSKFVGALVASLYCIFLLFLSGFITILVMGSVMGQDLSHVFSIIAEVFYHSIFYWMIIWWIFTTASGILLFYVSIALGQLFQNRRGLKAILFFFLLCLVLSIIGTAVNPLKDSYAVGYALASYGNIDEFGPNFIPGLIYEVIKIVSMYFTIHYISKYKLNLQ